MFKRCGNGFLAGALFLAAGMQWTALQSVAWLGMVVTYSETAPLNVALEHTFDGKHPCCLCKAIAAAKESEAGKKYAPPIQKLEFPPAPENFALSAPARFELLPPANDVSADPLARRPPTPPPRGFFV